VCSSDLVVCMLGFVEAFKGNETSLYFQTEFISFVNNLRKDLKDSELPFVLGRMEKNCAKTEGYRTYVLVGEYIEAMPRLIKNLVLSPAFDLPKECYCDSHHYTAVGYDVWAYDAVLQLVEKHLIRE
jgi:hypothetical protein